MKVEVAGHGRAPGNGGAGEVISGCVTAAFEIENRLRGVNGAVEDAVAGEIEPGVGLFPCR